MTEKKARKRANPQDYMPEAEEVARELAKAESMDDFFGKEGIFARLFANTLSFDEVPITRLPLPEAISGWFPAKP
jgi:hypothetical protein